MFKKPYKISTQTVLSSKDRKRVLQEFSCRFDPTASHQLYESTPELRVQKIEKTKILIYRNGDNPLFVDPSSNHEYFPTVYTVNAHPGLVKHVLWVPRQVQQFIGNGANLMWKGVLNFSELGEFRAGEMAVVRTIDGRNIAVGTMAIDKALMVQIGRFEGVAVNVLHYEGDWLFQSGTQLVKHGPGVKFEEADEVESGQTDAPKEADGGDGGVSNAAGGQPGEGLPVKAEGDTAQPPPDQEAGTAPQQPPDSDPKKTSPQPDSNDPEVRAQAQKQVDEALMEAFLNAIKVTLNDDDLPIENSSFWNQHMASCLPGRPLPDVKNSSYKKMGKFFSDLDEKGLILYKEASKKNPTPVIEKVNRSHPVIASWAPTIGASTFKKEQVEEAKPLRFQAPIKVVNLYRPDDVVLSYFGELIEREFYSKAELAAVMRGYLMLNKLLSKENVTLTDKLREDFKLVKTKVVQGKGGAKAKPKAPDAPKPGLLMPNASEGSDDSGSDPEAPDSEATKPSPPCKPGANTKPQTSTGGKPQAKPDAPKPAPPQEKLNKTSFKQLMEAVLKRCGPGYQLTDLKTGKQTIKKGRHFEIEVTIERCMNKYVTKVVGLDGYGFNLKEVLGDMQVHFATSGTIHEKVVSKVEIEELSIQGAFNDEMRTYLSSEFGIDENVIKIVDKANVKKKKK